jgi:hypothetical protein
MHSGSLTTIDYKVVVISYNITLEPILGIRIALTNNIKTTQGRFTLPKGSHELFYCWLSPCNRGLTNPEYKSTQQDLTDALRICRIRESR